ncbi:FIG111678: IS, phage, Tn; Transposon-related functions [Pseudomonas fluorescens]|nr:FIG111678: IS, phage, Tn; Transposon-related functions [Pseudomonas fluorescens]
MKLNPIVAHLKATCPTYGGRVAAGIDWDAVAESAKLPMPAAYVIAAADAAAPSKAQNAVIQNITDQFAVVVVLDAGDERGQEANDQLHDVRAELWRALVGWKPGPEYTLIEYDKGALVFVSRARVIYQFLFTAEFQIGRNNPHDPAETWHELELDGLAPFTGATINMDCIDPADPNLKRPGPDGRIEVAFTGDVTP